MPRPKGSVPKPSDGRCPVGYAVAMAKTGKLTCYKIPDGPAAAKALYSRLLKLNESRAREQRQKILGNVASPKKRGAKKSPTSKTPSPKAKRSPKARKSPKVPRPSPTSLTCPSGYVVAADKNGRLKCYKVPTDPKLHKRFFQKLHKQNKERVNRQLNKYGFTHESLFAKGKPGRKASSPSKRKSPKKKSPKRKSPSKKSPATKTRIYRKIQFSPSGRPLVNWSGTNVPLAWRGKAQKKISVTELRKKLAKISMQNSLESLKRLATNARHYPGGGLRGGETKKQIYNRLVRMRPHYMLDKKKKKGPADSDGKLPKTRKALRTLKQQADAWFKAM